MSSRNVKLKGAVQLVGSFLESRNRSSSTFLPQAWGEAQHTASPSISWANESVNQLRIENDCPSASAYWPKVVSQQQ